MNNNLSSTVSIIGAGFMGSGIAQKYASHGYEVIVIDKSDQSLKKSESSIRKLLHEAIERNLFSEGEVNKILGRIKFSDNLKDCQKANLIIEAIFEDLALKQELFLSLENLSEKNTLLATNTSSFTVANLQTKLKYPERVVGLHYFYHPAKNRLVELVGSSLTHKRALEQAQQIQESINKVVINSKDSPGFIVNRFFVPWLNESMRILEEGIANIATIEAAAKQFFQIGIGPFQLMNITGLPITFHSCLSLAKAFGDFYAPCPLIEHKIENHENWEIIDNINVAHFETITMRLLAVVIAISCHMVYEENICAPNDADVGARIGLLWPKGPFALLDQYRTKADELFAIMQGINNLPLSQAVKDHMFEKVKSN